MKKYFNKYLAIILSSSFIISYLYTSVQASTNSGFGSQEAGIRRQESESKKQSSGFREQGSELRINSSLLATQSSLLFYHSDHLGSTNITTDMYGSVVEKTKYYPYGEKRISAMSNKQRAMSSENRQQSKVDSQKLSVNYWYTSQEFDPETSFYYYGARYYDPILSYFISVDPEKLKSLKPYIYVGGNPIGFIDPNGKYRLGVQNASVNGTPFLGFTIIVHSRIANELINIGYAKMTANEFAMATRSEFSDPTGAENSYITFKITSTENLSDNRKLVKFAATTEGLKKLESKVKVLNSEVGQSKYVEELGEATLNVKEGVIFEGAYVIESNGDVSNFAYDFRESAVKTSSKGITLQMDQTVGILSGNNPTIATTFEKPSGIGGLLGRAAGVIGIDISGSVMCFKCEKNDLKQPVEPTFSNLKNEMSNVWGGIVDFLD